MVAYSPSYDYWHCVGVIKWSKSHIFPQASVEDWAGVLLHRIPSGNRLLLLNEIGLWSVQGCKTSFRWDLFIRCLYLMASFHCISQNQLLTKGMVILRDKIRFYEGTTDWINSLNTFCRGKFSFYQLSFWLVPAWLMQVRSYWTLWQRPGTSSSVMFSRCCRPSSTQFRYTNISRVRCFLPLQHRGSTNATTHCLLNDGHCFLCPGCVQGKEPSVRQLALLHFRNTIVLSVKLEDALSRPRARVPPSVTQMLLILQVANLIACFLTHFVVISSVPNKAKQHQIKLSFVHGNLWLLPCTEG